MCNPYIGSHKMVAMATSLSCTISQISAFCCPTTQILSTTNSFITVIHTNPVIAILVPKSVGMAMSLKTSKSAMSSSDSLTRKPTPRTKYGAASYHTTDAIVRRKPKWLPWQHSVGRPLKPHSITNWLVAIVHTKLAIAILLLKLVAMSTSLKAWFHIKIKLF